MPTPPVSGIPDTHRYYLIAFDERGRERTDDPDVPDGRLSRLVRQILRDEPVTDVFVMSLGWQGKIRAAIGQYDAWIAAMATCVKDIERVRLIHGGFRPLLVALYWPGQSWGDEQFPAAEDLAPPRVPDKVARAYEVMMVEMERRALTFGETGAAALLRQMQGDAKPGVRFHLMGHSFGCIVASAAVAGRGAAEPLVKPVDSLYLIQGALSCWEYSSDSPATGAPGQFYSIPRDGKVGGPILVTHSKHDTALRRLYPLAAGIRGEIEYEPESPPKFGALGAYGARGPGLDAVDVKMESPGWSYGFGPGVLYNLNADDVILEGGGFSGAHNDIAKPAVAHVLWEASRPPGEITLSRRVYDFLGRVGSGRRLPRRRRARDASREHVTTETADTRGGGADGGGPGGGPPEPSESAPPGSTPVVLSSEAPGELQVEAEGAIDVRIELEAEARPLEHGVETTLPSLVQQITVIVSSQGDAVELLDPWVKSIRLPESGRPATEQFAIRGRAPGATRFSVQFIQGDTPLGLVAFSVTVVPAAASGEMVRAQEEGAPPDELDKDVLRLMIREARDGERIYYQYFVQSEALGFHQAEFESPRFLERPGEATAASTPLRFVQSIFGRLTQALPMKEHYEEFEREVRGIGVDLSNQLFDAEFVRRLWAHRDEIGAIEVTSNDSHIPWELVRLSDPDRQGAPGVDRRFFAEYGLIRMLNGRAAPKVLRAGKWSSVVGSYPLHPRADVASSYTPVVEKLREHGIEFASIQPRPVAVYNAVAAPDFDVLHFACHGEAKLEEIENSVLIVGDRQSDAGGRWVLVHADTVAVDADFSERRPIVLLNACESGRRSASLTDLGGWPPAFLGAGAGVFVGTSWPVRKRPAGAFAATFYDALLRGDALKDAAVKARGAAREALDDASWLAYTIYGRPTARVARQKGD